MQHSRSLLLALLAGACGSPPAPETPTVIDTAPPPTTTAGAPDFDAICSWDCVQPPCDEPAFAVYTEAYLKYLAQTHGRSVATLRTVVSPGPLSSVSLKQRMFFESGWIKVSWQVTLPESPIPNPTKAELVELFEAEEILAPNFPPDGDVMPWSVAQGAIEDCESQYDEIFDAPGWCAYVRDSSPIASVTFSMTAYGVQGNDRLNLRLHLTVLGENIGETCEIIDWN